MLRKFIICAISASIVSQFSLSANAATEIQWWHAFSGRLGELLDEQAAQFNASQDEYVVVPTGKGNYSETLNAGIAAFRAKEHPHLLQVFEVGTATMMNAKGAIKPVYQLMEETGQEFDLNAYLAAVAGYYTTSDNEMLSLPYNSSTPVLYVNKDILTQAEIDPAVDLSTWQKVDEVLTQLKDKGVGCPYITSWQSWVHLENLSAYHDVPFASQENGFAGLDTELAFNSPLHVEHIAQLGQWVKDGKMQYGGRRNEAGAQFRAGECALFTESSAGYAGVKTEAQFEFEIRPLPYRDGVDGAPQNTIIGGASIWVLEGHEDEEYKGVAKLLSFLSTPEIQAAWHQNTGYLPITNAAAELTREQGFYDENPGTDVAIIQMTTKAPTQNSKGLRLGSMDQIRAVIDESLEAVWSGDQDAQTALDSAVERGNELLRRFEKTAQ